MGYAVLRRWKKTMPVEKIEFNSSQVETLTAWCYSCNFNRKTAVGRHLQIGQVGMEQYLEAFHKKTTADRKMPCAFRFTLNCNKKYSRTSQRKRRAMACRCSPAKEKSGTWISRAGLDPLRFDPPIQHISYVVDLSWDIRLRQEPTVPSARDRHAQRTAGKAEPMAGRTSPSLVCSVKVPQW